MSKIEEENAALWPYAIAIMDIGNAARNAALETTEYGDDNTAEFETPKDVVALVKQLLSERADQSRCLADLRKQLAALERECEELRKEAICWSYRYADFICALWPRVDKYEADHADYMQIKARATAAKAELAECKHELSSLRNTLDDLVAIQRERAEKAEAELDTIMQWAKGRCETCGHNNNRALLPEGHPCVSCNGRPNIGTNDADNWTPAWGGEEGREYGTLL